VKFEMASNVVVKDIMQKDVIVVNNNTVMQEVVALMNKHDKDAILVVQSGIPTGIITVKDVLIRAVEANVPMKTVIARMVYTNPLVTINEDATLEEAAKLMKHWNIKHLPVVDKKGALVGLLDDRAIVYAMPKLMSIMQEFCLRK
jgi:CBS domain-containing protein